MRAAFGRVLTHPVVGSVSIAAALVLAVWLGLAATSWQAERDRLEARILDLTRRAERSEAGLRQELASCRAAAEAPAQIAAAPHAAAPGNARVLLERQPEGIDACARMESADQAVLQNLKP